MPSTVTLTIPEGLPLVGAGLLSTVFVLAYQTIVVSKARTAAKIQYPQLYAEKAEQEASPEAKIFNCAQRSHQNTLESLPFVLITTAIGAIQHPKITASMIGVWNLGRVLYTRGYTTGDPKRRTFGAIVSDVALIGLLGASGAVVVPSLLPYLGL